jgi:hypothetical protein
MQQELAEYLSTMGIKGPLNKWLVNRLTGMFIDLEHQFGVTLNWVRLFRGF